MSSDKLRGLVFFSIFFVITGLCLTGYLHYLRIPTKPELSGECRVALIRGISAQQCVQLPGCSMTPADVADFVTNHIKLLDECKLDIGPLWTPGIPERPALGIPQTGQKPSAVL